MGAKGLPYLLIIGTCGLPWRLILAICASFAGPLLLGRFFGTSARKIMISGTYILSGALLAVTAYLFDKGTLTATTQTAAWVIIFFFASAGASAAHLTVIEIFPMETRAMAIAFFYAIGTGVGASPGRCCSAFSSPQANAGT